MCPHLIPTKRVREDHNIPSPSKIIVPVSSLSSQMASAGITGTQGRAKARKTDLICKCRIFAHEEGWTKDQGLQ